MKISTIKSKILNFDLTKIKINILLLVVFTIVGALFHFFNLNWGAPFYFHPDERNIASSVSQLNFPNQMNPHFFAYGSLPIYIIYFTGFFLNSISRLLDSNFHLIHPTFEQAIVLSRFYSALFATFLIPTLFLIGKKVKNEKTGLTAAFLATMSVGFIQFAHFGTFEMWLTFFTISLFWLCLQKINYKTIILIGLILGILIAIKISSIALFPLPILALILQKKRKIEKIKLFPMVNKLKVKISDKLNILSFLRNAIIILFTAFLLYCLTNPFVIFDTLSFKNSMNYESSLVIGTLLVFYTGEFFNTIPVLFQFMKIYPFLLNPFITLLFIPSFIYVLYKTIKTKKIIYLLLTTTFLILFVSQAFFFAKWTRYMVPTLPFIFLIISLALTDFLSNKSQIISKLTIATICVISSTFAFSYFITVFIRPDTRVEAYHTAQKTIPSDATIVSEVYDLGIIPFNQSFPHIVLFNFYELDNHSPEATPETLKQTLSQSQYIILPSQRLIKTRLANKEKFPQGNMFYHSLNNENLGYTKVYETPCDLFCKITYLGDPIFRFEQTANVFDRPTVIIFKKR